jgi:hypothetical protein
MMWWDRRTFANHAAPEQLPKILDEMRIAAIQAEAQQTSRMVAR